MKLQLADPRNVDRGTHPTLAFESATQGLDDLLDAMDSDQQLTVLDLGMPNQAVCDLFYGMRVRLHMGDLLRGLGGPTAQASPDVPNQPTVSTASLDDCLNHIKDERFDAILAWDLFNYFTVDELQCLLEYLARLSHEGTLLHCLMFTSTERPSVPSRLTPTRRRRLKYEPQTDVTVATDPALAALLADGFAGFSIAHSAPIGTILSEQLRRQKDEGSQVA